MAASGELNFEGDAEQDEDDADELETGSASGIGLSTSALGLKSFKSLAHSCRTRPSCIRGAGDCLSAVDEKDPTRG